VESVDKSRVAADYCTSTNPARFALSPFRAFAILLLILFPRQFVP
jgi:hypothetical protein